MIVLHTCLRRLVFVAAAVGVFALQSQAGIIINYPDFSSTAGLTLVGSTTTSGNQLELTPSAIGQSGAAYSTTAVTLGAADTFSTQFQFQFTKTGGIDPADGITFVLAQNPTGLGLGGGGLGYQGVPNSAAIEFDTFQNGGADSDSNHVAIDTNGVLQDLNLTDPYGNGNCGFPSTYLAAGCFANGDVWTVTMSFNGTTLNLSVWDTTKEGAPFVIYTGLPINFASFLGGTTAYVGFTGGTGSGFEQQDILNWELSNTATLGTPEPATLGLVFAGFAGLALVKYRRSRQR
jgi:hypothetical protein